MPRTSFATLVSLFLFLASSVPSQVEIFVAPSGKDTWPGTKEKPFATPARARDAVRRAKKAHPGERVTVYLRGGTYRLKETLVLGLEDSGEPGRPVTWKAFPGERPVFTGRLPLRGWRLLENPPPELPESARGKVWTAPVSFLRRIKAAQPPSPTAAPQMDRIGRFLTLYQGDRMLPRARGKGFCFPGKPAFSTADRRTFGFPRGLLQNWPDLEEGELAFTTRRAWESNIIPLERVDPEKGVGRLAYSATYEMKRRGWNDPPMPDALVENVLAVLDEPGEWVLDSSRDLLYFLPPSGGDPGETVEAPVLTELVRVEGGIDYDGPMDEPVRHLVFEGITFTGGDRFPWHGRTGWGLQHDWERFDSPTAMLRFRGAEDCAVENCRFVTAGSTGLRLDLHCRKIRVAGCLFRDLGGVAILLAGYGPGLKDVNRGNTIESNLVERIGTLYRGSPGIFLWQSGGNLVAHNLLRHLPYAGICVTGRIVWNESGREECSQTIRWHETATTKNAWTYAEREGTWALRAPYLHSRNNLVFRNDIHHVMEYSGDGNCIYVSGAGAGNRVVENFCHDCPSPHMNNAVRCDDDQEETFLSRNIVFRTRGYAEGFLIKGKNYVLENLVVDLRPNSRHRGYIRFYSGDVRGSIIRHNVFYACVKGVNATNPPFTRRGRPAPRLSDTLADRNLYFNTADPLWGARHLERQRKLGIEKHSVAADPLFTDIEKLDFRFRPGSPALKLGLRQPVSVSETGPRPPYRDRLLGKETR